MKTPLPTLASGRTLVCSRLPHPAGALLATLRSVCLSLFCWLAVAHGVSAADFRVTSPGSFFSINGQSPNPTLTVVRGELYTFAVTNSSVHPFRILNTTSATNNTISNGIITWRVPTNAVNYRYECAVHHFFGEIITIPPPSVRIVHFAAGTNFVLKSTGTNNWTPVPEFKTNVAGSNWFALTVQSNRFSNGTNETICGRPPGSNVFIRIRSQRN